METSVVRRRKRSASAERIKNAYNGANNVEVEVIEAVGTAKTDDTPKEMRVCAYHFCSDQAIQGDRKALRIVKNSLLAAPLARKKSRFDRNLSNPHCASAPESLAGGK